MSPGSPILKFWEPLSTNSRFKSHGVNAALEAELLNNVAELDTKSSTGSAKISLLLGFPLDSAGFPYWIPSL